MNAWPPSIPQELRDAPQQALQEYTVTYARQFLKTACRHLSVSDEAFLDHFDQLLASTGFLRPLTISTADPAHQTFTRRGMLKFVHDCLYNSCSAGNRCSFCALNPNRRCAQGCGVAYKQTEFEALEAPCEALLKVAIHAIEADNAQSSSAGLDLADVFLEFSLLNGSLHDSYCQDLGAGDDLTLEQLRRCEVLTYRSKESDHNQLLRSESSLEMPSEGHRVRLKLAPGADSILPDLRVMRNSNKRIGPKNPDYKLLAHAIDTSTGRILAQAVSEKFSVLTSRSQGNRKAAIPCWTDDVKCLEKCGTEKCKGLADLVAHAGVNNMPEDCIKKVTTVRQFQELVEYVKHWPECPFRSLMPNEAIAHAATALGPDNQMRVWRSKDTPNGLMYPCQQAQIDWGAKSPAVLMEYEPQQGMVRLTLASDLNRDQKALVSSLAAAASEQWQQELHPGWSMAAADSEPLLNQLLQEVQRVGGRSLVLSNDACAGLLNQVPSAPVVSSAAAAPVYPIPAEVPPQAGMYPTPDEVPPQASMQHQSPPAIFPLPPAPMLGQPEPEMYPWLGPQNPMPSHEPMVVHHTPMDSHPDASFTVAEAPHTIPHPCQQQTPQPFAHGPAGGGLSQDRVIPGRLMYAQMHSQSCSRVHPRGFDRTPSFTDEQRAKRRNTAPASELEGMGSDISGWNSEEMNEPFAMDVQDCLASAQTTQQTSVHEEGADASSGEDQLAVIQPAIQHVVLSFLAKMHALVARRRMQRGETMSLSLQLDQRRRLHQCVATWTKSVRQSANLDPESLGLWSQDAPNTEDRALVRIGMTDFLQDLPSNSRVLLVVLVQNSPAPLPSILRLQEKAAGEVMTQLYTQLIKFVEQCFVPLTAAERKQDRAGHYSPYGVELNDLAMSSTTGAGVVTTRVLVVALQMRRFLLQPSETEEPVSIYAFVPPFKPLKSGSCRRLNRTFFHPFRKFQLLGHGWGLMPDVPDALVVSLGLIHFIMPFIKIQPSAPQSPALRHTMSYQLASSARDGSFQRICPGNNRSNPGKRHVIDMGAGKVSEWYQQLFTAMADAANWQYEHGNLAQKHQFVDQQRTFKEKKDFAPLTNPEQRGKILYLFQSLLKHWDALNLERGQ
ncbi:hypothetical protein WJX82_004365 [Trebouxia sp. C0006]